MSASDLAFVLAAGRGDRMQPLTARRAKSTLPVLGRPLLARVMDGLAAQGVRSFLVNAHHQSESVRRTVAETLPPGCTAEVFVEPLLMGTGGALDAPRGRLAEQESFVLHNGDTLVDSPLTPLVEAAHGAQRIGALLVRPGRTRGYGGVTLAGGSVSGRFRVDAPMPAGDPATFLGVSVLRRDILDRVVPGRPAELFHDLLDPLLAEGWSLAAVPAETSWLEFTTPRAYLAQVTSSVAGGRADGRAALPGGVARVNATADGAVFVAQGAELEHDASIRGGAVLERDALVRRGATLANTVVLERAVVASGVTLVDVIVDSGVRVTAGATHRGGVLIRAADGYVFQPFIV